jgi:hypothetical protein
VEKQASLGIDSAEYWLVALQPRVDDASIDTLDDGSILLLQPPSISKEFYSSNFVLPISANMPLLSDQDPWLQETLCNGASHLAPAVGLQVIKKTCNLSAVNEFQIYIQYSVCASNM